jgi:hypothetical protein
MVSEDMMEAQKMNVPLEMKVTLKIEVKISFADMLKLRLMPKDLRIKAYQIVADIEEIAKPKV